MALDLKKLRDIDSKYQSAVRGYLKTHVCSISCDNTPDLVVCCILAFYYNPEYFAFSPADISDGNTTVTATDINQNVYGNLHIPSTSNDCHVWTFIMHASKRGAYDDTAFGVVNAQCFTEEGLCMEDYYGHTVGVDQQALVSTKTDEYDAVDSPTRFGVGDVIKIKLDLKRRDLSFAVNESEWKSIVQDIYVSEGFHYKMVVFLGFVDDCVKLLDYACCND